MICLVSGGAGFIGSHIVDKLLSLKNIVIVLDNFSSGKEENLKEHIDNINLKIIKRDIRENVKDIFSKYKIDAVFHLAAITSVPYSIENPKETNRTNVNGTINLLECCRRFGVKRFIFSSSCAVYGNQSTLPFVESMNPNPLSPYALSKLIGEQQCKLFTSLYGLECINLRYFNVYGPRQNPDGDYSSLIPKFIRLLKESKTPKINGSGEQTRDFVFVSDIVNANLSALNTNNKTCFGESFNIGSATKISVNEVTKNIILLSEKNISPIYGPSLIEPKDALADISKAKSILNWEPNYKFEQGLKETFNFLSNPINK